jgi:hypothetical protein
MVILWDRGTYDGVIHGHEWVGQLTGTKLFGPAWIANGRFRCTPLEKTAEKLSDSEK